MKVWIGIDPGINGGIACIYQDGKVTADKMPETEKDLFELLSRAIIKTQPFALLERVSSSPQMGVKSAFTFGQGYGALRMALIALGIAHETVNPAKWQKSIGCLTGGDKNVSKARAQQLFPSIKITHAKADSLLLAEYNRRTFGS